MEVNEVKTIYILLYDKETWIFKEHLVYHHNTMTLNNNYDHTCSKNKTCQYCQVLRNCIL